MNKIKSRFEKIIEYPIEKASKILEEDGTTFTYEELIQIVNALTLLAQNEAKLLNTESAENEQRE